MTQRLEPARPSGRTAAGWWLLVASLLPAPMASAQSLATTAASASAMSDGTFLARRLPALAYRGGPFLRHPRIVTVTFSGDDAALVSRLDRFGDTITRTSWWRTVTDGYCARPAIASARDGQA